MHGHIGYLFLGAIALLVAGGWVKAFVRGKQRHAALPAMGFKEVPREQVFANAKAIAHTFPMDVVCVVSPTVGLGRSALGQTVLFTVNWFANNNPVAATIAGVQVDPGLPDFQVRYTSIKTTDEWAGKALQHLAGQAPNAATGIAVDADPGVAGPPMLQMSNSDYRQAAHHPERFTDEASVRAALHPAQHRIEIADPRFSRNHLVYGSDDASVRAMLTPAFLEALAGDESGDLEAHKTGEWLFVYAGCGRHRATPVAPVDYPQWLARCVALAQTLNLHPATAS